MIQSKLSRGFSLMELVLVLSIMGIVLTLGVPMFSGIPENGNRKVAITKAESIFSAQMAYRSRVSNAATVYAACSTQNARWALLKDRLPGAPDSLDDYMPTGFTVELSTSLTKKPVLYENGTEISY